MSKSIEQERTSAFPIVLLAIELSVAIEERDEPIEVSDSGLLNGDHVGARSGRPNGQNGYGRMRARGAAGIFHAPRPRITISRLGRKFLFISRVLINGQLE